MNIFGFQRQCKHRPGKVRNARPVGELGIFPNGFRGEATCEKCGVVFELLETAGPVARQWLWDRVGPLAIEPLPPKPKAAGENPHQGEIGPEGKI